MRKDTNNFPPKDGGWGWFVVLGAGIVSFLIGGFIRTFSLTFEALRTKFDSSASAAAWVASINVTMALCSGPLSTMLSTRFSVRAVGMVGSLLMFLGFLASAYAPSLPYMYVAYGIAGIGQGFLHTPTLIIIAQWFDKKRARATSLGLMMDGFGTLAMAPLLQFLFDYYGYSGTMLIVAALMANHLVVAALYRPPDKLDYVDDVDVSKHLNEVETTNEIIKNDPNKPEIEVKEHLIHNRTNSTHNQRNMELIESLNQNGNNFAITRKQVHLLKSNDNEASIKLGDFGKPGNEECHRAKSYENYHEVTVLVPDLVPCEEKSKKNVKVVLKYFDYHLFKMGRYLTFSLLMACTSLCVSMCNTHIAGLASESKLSTSHISLLISSMGGISMIARFLSGFLFDNSTVRRFRIHLFTVFGFVIAVSLLLSLWIRDIIGFYILWLTYITGVGVFNTQESVILADIVGADRFSSAIGLNRFCRGIGVLIGPTVGGYLKDYTGVYDYTFIFGGLCLLVALVLFELSVIIEQRSRKNQT